MSTTTDPEVTEPQAPAPDVHTLGPLDDAQAQLAFAVERLGLGPGAHAVLSAPRRS